jgi:hypothetical protein
MQRQVRKLTTMALVPRKCKNCHHFDVDKATCAMFQITKEKDLSAKQCRATEALCGRDAVRYTLRDKSSFPPIIAGTTALCAVTGGAFAGVSGCVDSAWFGLLASCAMSLWHIAKEINHVAKHRRQVTDVLSKEEEDLVD